MGRYRVGIETRERILAATRRLCSEVGIDDVTLKAITDEAGVGAGSFYNLFDSKESAVFEVVREAIEAVDPDPSGVREETLEALVDAFVSFVTDQSPIARIYLQLAVGRGLTDPAIGARVLRSHHQRLERFTEAWLREAPGLDREEAEERAVLTLSSLTGLAIAALLDPSFELRAHARHLIPSRRILVEGAGQKGRKG